MEITARSLWTIIHGMGFGALFLLAASGALIELWFALAPAAIPAPSPIRERFLKLYLVVMAALAWLAVLTGTYIVYPWYRATPPAGAADLSAFPQKFLMHSPTTIGWHSLGMEWKEHVAWFAPIAITMVAFVFIKYGRDLRNHKQLRAAVLGFALASVVSAAAAGFFGAMINKYAPVQGGATIQLSSGGEK